MPTRSSSLVFKSSELGILPNTDISDELSYIINTLPNNSTFILESGNYILTSKLQYETNYYAGILIKNKINFSLVLEDVTITQPYINYNDYSMIVLSNCDTVNIIGINSTLIGNSDLRTLRGDTSGEWGHDINISTSKNININNLTIKNCWGDCIYIDYGNSIYISNCKLLYGRRWCFTIISGDNVTLKDSELIYKKYSSINYLSGFIDLEQNLPTEVIGDIYIYNNTLTCENPEYCLCGGGGGDNNIEKIEFVNNTLNKVVVHFDNANSLIHNNHGMISNKNDPCSFSGNNVVITNNTFFSPNNFGYIIFSNINSLTFNFNEINNITPDTKVVDGLVFNNIQNLNIKYNTFNDIGGNPYDLTNGCLNLTEIADAIIRENTFNCKNVRCILLKTNCKNITINDNSILAQKCIEYENSDLLTLSLSNNTLISSDDSFVEDINLPCNDKSVNKFYNFLIKNPIFKYIASKSDT